MHETKWLDGLGNEFQSMTKMDCHFGGHRPDAGAESLPAFTQYQLQMVLQS